MPVARRSSGLTSESAATGAVVDAVSTIACSACGIAAAFSRPLVRVLRQQPQDQRLQRARHLRVVPGRRDGCGVDVLRDDRHRVVAEERRAAGHHFVRHAAERVEVAAGVRLAAQRLLRRHVGDGADHHPFHRQAERSSDTARPKSPILAVPSAVSQMLPGLRSRWMMPRSCACARPCCTCCAIRIASGIGSRRSGVLVEHPVEIAAAHVLRDDVRLPAVIADVEDGHDVRVVAEAAHRLGLALDAGQSCVVQAFGLDHRDGDVSVQLFVVREVDLLAPALAEEALDDVATVRRRRRAV